VLIKSNLLNWITCTAVKATSSQLLALLTNIESTKFYKLFKFSFSPRRAARGVKVKLDKKKKTAAPSKVIETLAIMPQ